MVTLTADERIAAWLRQASERTEVRGLSGQLLGYFVPQLDTEEEKYERLRKLIYPEEIDRRWEEEKDKGFTYEQVMAHPRKLESGR